MTDCFKVFPPGTKPMKFQASVGIYLLTLAWFFGNLTAEARRHWVALAIAFTAVITGLFEVIYITWQGAQNVKSHFNYDNQFTTVMYSLMGVWGTAPDPEQSRARHLAQAKVGLARWCLQNGGQCGIDHHWHWRGS